MRSGQLRISEFWVLMNDEFGEAYASSLSKSLVLGVLGDRSPVQALDAGHSPREVWEAVCGAMDVPPSRRLGVQHRRPM